MPEQEKVEHFSIAASTATDDDPTGSDLLEDRLQSFHRHRGLLFSIAYRMLGSAVEAEDLVQETYIRWHQARNVEIQSPRAFLVTIISRLSINHLQSARVKRERYFGQWLPEPVLTGPADDSFRISAMDESLSTAFLMLLERLTPMERAAFLLHEVFDYEYGEIARILEQTEANCRQIFHRARKHLKEVRPRFDTSARQHQELLQLFFEASERGDMDGLLALFSKDIILYADGGGKATAVPNPVCGADNIVRFLRGARAKLLPEGLIRRISVINGQPGLVAYRRRRPFGVLTLRVANGKIHNIYIVTNPEKLSRIPLLPAACC